MARICLSDICGASPASAPGVAAVADDAWAMVAPGSSAFRLPVDIYKSAAATGNSTANNATSHHGRAAVCVDTTGTASGTSSTNRRDSSFSAKSRSWVVIAPRAKSSSISRFCERNTATLLTDAEKSPRPVLRVRTSGTSTNDSATSNIKHATIMKEVTERESGWRRERKRNYSVWSPLPRPAADQMRGTFSIA